ncbi:hypothetical protein AMS68_006570 [Peltaster fructicola]|uniref:Roadblock/LAMTOR2 domain-containing protein n=1 Tax=Peltaster fructicola TaxID=286661 RepID=A0A6H0Y205_9PEZI|nr:hypothetical protein AMS68_006570 [Peltaster fructicola]
MQQTTPSEETTAQLARLAARPGVQSTLVLSRESGAIVRSTGLLTADEETDQATSAPQANGSLLDGEIPKTRGTRNAEEVAKLVWKYVQACSELIENLNGEADEVKLTRLRTKKNELVIVPDAKFLLVVVHDTPPA